jgi:hypothetical protein
MPQLTARAAKAAGGHTVGVSPAKNLAEHTGTFHSPTESLDAIQMTGAGAGMGLIAREKQNIQHSDILVFAGGRSGTLGEMLFAMQSRKVIALLEDSTGVTAKARAQILPAIGRSKAVVVSDRDPGRLMEKALAAHAELAAQGVKGPAGPVRALKEKAGRAVFRIASRASEGLRRAAHRLAPSRRRSRLQLHHRPVVNEQTAQSHNIYTFFGDAHGMSPEDHRKVHTLVKHLARDRTGGRSPLGPPASSSRGT